MALFPSKTLDDEEQIQSSSGLVAEPDETLRLLHCNEDEVMSVKHEWKPAPGFVWIEIGRRHRCLSLEDRVR